MLINTTACTILLAELQAMGITDQAVLAAMAQVPRETFVTAEQKPFAYVNRALPYKADQTISQPYIVALMTASIHRSFVKKVLEVGTGSAYQATILATLFSQVYTVERLRVLFDSAVLQLKTYSNVHCHYGNGLDGLPDFSPYDAILVTACCTTVPTALLNQLADPGLLVLPLTEEDGTQSLYCLEKNAGVLSKNYLTSVRFVPAIDAMEND